MSAPPVIHVQQLQKTYDKVEAVKGIDFQVAEGEVFGLLGPNGAGKTSTIEILEGLAPSYRRRTPRCWDLILTGKSSS